MADVTLGYQIGMGMAGLVGGIGITAKILKKKLLNNNAGCPETGCQTVQQHGKDIDNLCHAVNNEIFPKINKTAEDVSYIKGRIDGVLGVIK